MIELKSVCRHFDGLSVIKDLSFSFPDRGVFALMAPSGRGKTTLLRLLAGLDRPDAGEIVSTHRQTSVAFQEPRLLPWYDARRNLTLVTDEKTAEEWLAVTELSDFANALPAALSGGMQQRLSLARALAFGGDLLLLDEPFSGLDVDLKERLAPAIRRAAENALLIFVTHDIEEARLLGATPLWLCGTPINAIMTKKPDNGI